MSEAGPRPDEVRLNRAEHSLKLIYADGRTFALPAEYLRVHSPSAEVKGHGGGPRRTVAGKRNVAIERVEPVGNYAIKPVFSDGHETGIFTWSYLFELGVDFDRNWQSYLDRLEKEGLSRDPS